MNVRSFAAPSSDGEEFWPHSSEQKLAIIATRRAAPRFGRVCATEYTKNSTEDAKKMPIQENFGEQIQPNQHVPERYSRLLR